MARKPRIEYAGAVYHVMSRSDRQKDIFNNDRDRTLFLDTLGEACERYGWFIHAFVLMDNHYHLLLETPEPNLVVGMKWLQGTYTQRFNCRYKEWGHLFQGRYKALIIQSDSGDYFSTVATYIHLNPVRARLLDFGVQDLSNFVWSSYPLYFDGEKRPAWLRVDRVLGTFQWLDDYQGLTAFRQMMKKRVLEVFCSKQPMLCDERWKKIRKGWCLGDLGFREEMEMLVDERIRNYDRRSYLGAQAQKHDEAEAQRLFESGLRLLGLVEDDLVALKKGSWQKKCIAWKIRRNTSVKNDWICEKLMMGRSSNLARYIRDIETSIDPQVVQMRKMMK